MPVTAKLSRRFYETFGDEIANEFVEWFNTVDLTYRAELRDQNELNFARFDARMEQRFAERDARIDKRFAELDVRLERRFGEIGERFARIDARFDAFEARIMRWMFVYWTGTMLATAGFVLTVIRAR